MAEGLLRARCCAAGQEVRVESAGIQALTGFPADPFAVDLLGEQGIDITGHIARQLTFDILRAFDLVLVMEEFHKRQIEQLAPFGAGNPRPRRPRGCPCDWRSRHRPSLARPRHSNDKYPA